MDTLNGETNNVESLPPSAEALLAPAPPVQIEPVNPSPAVATSELLIEGQNDSLDSHYVKDPNARPNELIVHVCDGKGPGGAHHRYSIWWPSKEGGPGNSVIIEFQNGPIPQAGVNGVTQEALLAIVKHRLQCFQAGPYACDENQTALEFVTAALESLHDRTRKRIARNVEGTHTV